MAKRSKTDDEHALERRADAWLGRKEVEIPTQRALEALEPDQLLAVAKDHHARGMATYVRDLLPIEIVIGLAMRAAKPKVQRAGLGWARWVESSWEGMSESTVRGFMGAAETYLQLEASSPRTRTPQQLMATMAQGMRAIGCRELAKPAAREPRKPAPKADPDTIDADYTVAVPAGAPPLPPPPELDPPPPPPADPIPYHPGCLHPTTARRRADAPAVEVAAETGEPAIAQQGVPLHEDVPVLGDVGPQEPYGTDDEDEPDLPEEESDGEADEELAAVETLAAGRDEIPPEVGLGPACTCGHLEEEHSGPFGTCATDDCGCDGYDGGANVEEALAVLWSAYKDAGPARAQILRAIELLGDDSADAEVIDQEDADEEHEGAVDHGDPDEPEAFGAPGPRPAAIERALREELAKRTYVLTAIEREDLAARLVANPLDVEAITALDDAGEVGALLKLAQRHWARLRRVADELDRDARLERIDVPPQERVALLDVREQLRGALEVVKALALGQRPPEEPSSFPSVEELNAAKAEMDEHPLRTAPVAVVAFRVRQILPRLRTDALRVQVHEYQVANAALAAVRGLLDDMSGQRGERKDCYASTHDGLMKIKRALTAAQSEAEALVAERCPAGSPVVARSVEAAKKRKSAAQEQREKKAAKKKGGKK